VVRAETKSLEIASRVGDCRFLDILKDDVSEPVAKLSDDSSGIGPEVASDEATSSGRTEGLAGEAGTENISGNSICAKPARREAAHVLVDRDLRPALSDDGAAELIRLAEGDGAHSGSLEPE
jgi:hypothetical protein